MIFIFIGKATNFYWLSHPKSFLDKTYQNGNSAILKIGQKWCQISETDYSCCPFTKAVCYKDMIHWCPWNTLRTPGLSRFWDQSRANSALYIAFWSVEPTDFKNVIVENIHWALSEDAEVKQPRNSKRQKLYYKKW